MSLHREPVYRHLTYVFAWRGIQLRYLFLLAIAAAIATFLMVFPTWVIAWLADYMGEPLGPVGTFFFVTLRPPWWGPLSLFAGLSAAMIVYQWRRDPQLLGRKLIALRKPKELSPWVDDRRDRPLWLQRKDF